MNIGFVESSTSSLNNTAVRSGLVPAVPSSSERSALALPVRNTQHTSRASLLFGSTKDRLTDLHRAWGMCDFPAGGLARHGRASAAFSSRRPTKSLFHRPASPVRTAAAPERFFRGHVSLRGGLPNSLFSRP
ncbi:MAG: hypothetical protein ACK53K_07855 [Burkholderiales bacterium]